MPCAGFASDHRASLLLGCDAPIGSRNHSTRETRRHVFVQGLCSGGLPPLWELQRHQQIPACLTRTVEPQLKLWCPDPCEFHSSTVTGLLEHYKDPSVACFFFLKHCLWYHWIRLFSSACSVPALQWSAGHYVWGDWWNPSAISLTGFFLKSSTINRKLGFAG